MAFVSALACIGGLGASATAALATGTTVPAAGLFIPFSESPSGNGPLGPVPSNCPSTINPGYLAGFLFTSGNAVNYGTSMVRNGGNAEGTALFEQAPTAMDVPTPLYDGHLHAWFGQTANAQGQFYFGETLSFQGTSVSDPTQSLTITASGGDTVAAPRQPHLGLGSPELHLLVGPS